MNNINGHKEVISEIKKLRNVLLEAEVDKSTHVNANGVRTHLNSLGYAHKSTIDELGDITPELANIIKKVSSAFKKEMPELKIRFGAGRDSYHKSTRSRHTQGNANDIVFGKTAVGDLRVSDDETLDKISTLLCAARQSIDGFTFIDEYRHPSPRSTGPHYHLSWSENGKDESNSTSNFCSSIPESNLANFEFPEPVPEWLDWSQSKVDTEFEKIIDKFGTKKISVITTESECEKYVKEVIELFGEGHIIKKDNFCNSLLLGLPIKEFVEAAKETEKVKEDEKKKEEEMEKAKEEMEKAKKEMEKAKEKKEKEEKESSLTEELKNFKRFIK
jgi:hypothetical protein